MRRWTVQIALLLALGAASMSVDAQTIVQAKGVDSRVDYTQLDRIGPWDDRNYQLTQEEIALLSPNEVKMSPSLPAFYRVELRKEFPEVTQAHIYPRSAYNRFLIKYDGYLIDGKIYESWERNGERIRVVMSNGVEHEEFVARKQAQKKLTGEARVTNPNGGAESAIAIKPTDPNIVIAGSNGPATGQDMHYSSDGGATWTFSGALPLGGACCDPTVGWKTDGSKAYAATLGNGVYVYRSGDNGVTWTDLQNEPGNDPRREIDTGFVDKEYLHVDNYSGSPHVDNLYLTWHTGTEMRFSRSTDDGHTWDAVTRFTTAPRGIGSDITSDKAGTVYYVWAATPAQEIALLRSTDGGASFGAPTKIADTEGDFEFALPAMNQRLVFIYAAADSDLSDGPFGGSVYVAWTDSTATTGPTAANNHGRIQVAYSRNGGDSWTVTTPHETADANSVDRFHQWIRVGPDGRVYVIFYDTRNNAARTDVDLYYSVSSDGAQTWDPPQRLTSVTSPKITNGFEWGDYNGLDVVMNDLIAIYTDNRDENGGAAQSVDVYAAGIQVGPSNEIFSDGFESGNTSQWSIVTP